VLHFDAKTTKFTDFNPVDYDAVPKQTSGYFSNPSQAKVKQALKEKFN
jgi:hypothetical protein